MKTIARLLIRGPEAPYVLSDLDDAFDRDIAAGMTPSRARRRYAANVVASALSVLASRLGTASLRLSLPRLGLDLKLGVRMLLKYPALTLVATFALGVGIPVGLAPLHAVDALQANLPEDPEGRIRLLRYWNPSRFEPTTFHDAELWRASLSSFESIGASRSATYSIEIRAAGSAVASTELLMPGAEVTASTFDMLGVAPLRGRVLRAEDERPGGPDVVVIGESMAQSVGTVAADLVGTSIRIGGVPHDVVGVMPEGFRFPSHQQVWLPLREQAWPEGRALQSEGTRKGPPVTIYGRLADGVWPDSAQAELSAVHASRAAERPDIYSQLHPEVVHSSFMAFGFPKGGLRALPEFAMIQGLTLIPLLIACVNVGLLIFARTATRTSEFAVRTALGASRGRILAQVFTESLVLAILATGLGLLLLNWLPEKILTAFKFIPMPYWLTPELSVATVLRALGLACASAVIAGVIPVLRTTSRSVLKGLQRGSSQRTSSGGTRFGLTSSVMIVADVAVAVAAFGLAIGIGHRVAITFANERTDGIKADRFLSVAVTMVGGGFGTAQDALVDRLRREPGVRAVAVGTGLPRMDHTTRIVEIEGEDVSSGHRVRAAFVAPGFFEGLGAPMLAGRSFDGRDVIAGSKDPAYVRTVIVNTSFVGNVLGGKNAVGRRIRYRENSEGIGAATATPSGAPSPWLEIVGVVGHLGMRSLTPEQDDGIYQPLVAGSVPRVLLAIEADGDPMALAPRVRDIAREIDARMVIASPITLDRVFEGDWYIMTAVVGGVALLVGVLLALATSGLYAIMSFTIAERRREIGIRIALGADRRSIAMQVARRAIIQIAIGVAIGLPLAAAVFFEMQEQSAAPSAWLAIGLALAQGVGILLVVGLAACLVPTRRALRISPVEALKGD